MESRNVVVCDNGTGVSSPLSLSSPSLRSISFLDPPSDLSMRRISGPSFSHIAPVEFAAASGTGWITGSRVDRRGVGCSGIEEFWDQSRHAGRVSLILKRDDSIL